MTRSWLNGQLRDDESNAVSLLDHGFTVGDGVFETLLVRSCVPFALDMHLARLQYSSNGLGLGHLDLNFIRAGITQLLENLSPDVDHRLRITVTSGSGPLGSDRLADDLTYALTIAPTTRWPDSARVAISSFRKNSRSAIAGLKTTSYAENVVILANAKALGCSESLILDTDEKISEGTGSNIFWISGSTLFTPGSSTGLLCGITRALTIHYARDIGIDLQIGNFPIENILRADCAFLTSSTRNLQRIETLIDTSGEVVKHFGTHEIFTKLNAHFLDQQVREVNPTNEWRL